MASRVSALPGSTTIEQGSSWRTKAKHIWDFTYECILKEFGSSWRHLWYRVVYWVKPHCYDLNPVNIPQAKKANQIAKVVLLMHGSAAHPSCFIPLAKKLQRAGIRNVYTVSLTQTDDDPIPIKGLSKRIQNITKKYLNKGYTGVNYTFVGHSLGGLVGAKYIWRGKNKAEHSSVSKMISIAGRLKYLPNKFAWFCSDVKPEIKKTYQSITQDPNKVTLYTIWGSRDGLVPKKSVHFQEEPTREKTVKGWGHGGVVFAPETHQQIVSWLAHG